MKFRSKTALLAAGALSLFGAGVPLEAEAAATNIGRTTIGTVAEPLNYNYQNGPMVHVPSNGTLTSASFYLDGKAATTGTETLRVNIYGGGSNKPVELLGTSTSTQTVSAGRNAGWLNFNLPNIQVGTNWDVWAQLQGANATVVRLFKDGSGRAAWGPASNIAQPPDPSYAPIITTNNYSAYLTLADSASPTAMPTTSTRPGWAYSYGEDFNRNAAVGQFGAVYGANWKGYDCIRCDTSRNTSRPEPGSYQPDKVISVANSQMKMHVGYEAATGQYNGAAPFPQPPANVNGGSQEYLGMRYSIRFKATGTGTGWKTAWLLWPSSWNWDDGEIDFPEGSLDGSIHGFSHRAGVGAADQNALAADSGKTYADWHVATTEWIPKTATSTGSVEFFLDGVSIGKTTRDVPSKPMHLTLQTETHLGADNPPQGSAYDVFIDWLVVESRI